MTKHNAVKAVLVGQSPTAALEVVRWLQKWGIDAGYNKTEGYVYFYSPEDHGALENAVFPGDWIIYDLGEDTIEVVADGDFR